MVITYSVSDNPFSFKLYADGEAFFYQATVPTLPGFVPFADIAEARSFALAQIAQILPTIDEDPAQPEDPEVSEH